MARPKLRPEEKLRLNSTAEAGLLRRRANEGNLNSHGGRRQVYRAHGLDSGAQFSPLRPSSSISPLSLRPYFGAQGSVLPYLSYRTFRPKLVMELINANPVVHEKKERRVRQAPETTDENTVEPIDQLEIFDHVRDIKDPEHPYSLEELNVVTEDSIELNDKVSHVRVTFTPTVEHCSMATIIGLCLRVKLMRSLPPRYKVDIRVAPGSHATEAAVNKQLNDKERVAAALENPNLLDIVEECLSPTLT